MESGESETVEWQQETKDGDRIWIEATVNPAVIGGEDRIVSMQRDITKRRRREREYEQIFNSVNDAIAIFDPDTADIVDVNDTYHEMLGYDDLETLQELGIEGLSVTEEGFTRERGQALVREAAKTGQPKMVEWRGETRDGDQIWLEVTLAPADIGGETRVLSMLRDITERKHREREYEQIFNDVTDAITVHDPETGRLLDVNDTMCELTGYDREALLGEGQASINVAEEGYSTDRAKEIVQEVMEQNEKRTLEWLMERADGERRWLEVNATPTTLNGEERYLAIMRDVTEQRRTERRLREILERIDEAIYLTRAAEITNPTLRSDDLGAGYESIWGESLQGIFERYENGFFDTLHPDEVSGYKEFIDDLGADFDEGTWADRYSREYRIVRADREIRWVRSDFYPIEWPTGSLRIVIVSRDITDRKARERRIASFDDATDDLATADTRAEATRTAVTAATDSLELPAIGAFLYDSDDGVLRPEVLEGPFPSEVATDSIAPGDGPLWEGFATGTIVGADSTGDESGTVSESNRTRALAELTDWRAISLGNHGILLVGSPDDSLGSETIQSAHVLAATLEAALNHQRGQQQLADQEEQLRTQTERAERLDRIARLAQQVEAAITDTSNPGQVERAVCDRLVNAGAYDLAWIGGMDVGSVRLAPRSVVGAPEQYVEGMDLTTAEDAGDPHPAVTAWRTDEPRVADSLVANGPAGDWRQRALSEGYQSLCAVPLTYDGVTHGVLTVGTDSPNTFGDRERDVLAQLGLYRKRPDCHPASSSTRIRRNRRTGVSRRR
ncbi:PAS domain S-box protein [Natronoarchaeum sp. GCM10025703]|uniref:PAS domain S-box protein n=1 Tax=Natronoarchaeum sp. GCM10025703 TaxID=3252685 RepID=UPI00360AAA4C